MKIEELNLTLCAYHCLKRAGIHTTEQLSGMTSEDLMRIKSVGVNTAAEILCRLKEQARTNADRIRSMNDEELAAFIRDEQCNAVLLQRIESMPEILHHLQQNAEKGDKCGSVP